MLFNNSVDSIVKDFNSVVGKLEKLITHNKVIIGENNQVVSLINQDSNERAVEINRASRIKENIAKLLNV